MKTVSDGNGRYFHVTGSSLRIVPGNGGWAAGLEARDYTNTATAGYIAGAHGNGVELTYTFYGGTAYDDPAMVILANKNVGIGTTNPAHKLHVNGGIYSDEYVQVGSARLKWDGTTGALYVEKSDGTQCGFYATGFLSANGLNNDAGGVSAGIDEGQLADYLTEHGYATQSWVTQQGYLTEVPEVDLTGYATETWVNSQGYLTSSALNGYATQNWVNQQGFLKSVNLATIGDLHSSWDNVLKAQKPTTLAGYGITDAYTKSTADGRYFRREISTITSASADADDLFGYGAYINYAGSMGSFPNEYGLLYNLAIRDNDYRLQLYAASGGVLYYKVKFEALNSANWIRLLTTTSGNAVSATKLQTARTLWGRPFDGTKNVSGEH